MPSTMTTKRETDARQQAARQTRRHATREQHRAAAPGGSMPRARAWASTRGCNQTDRQADRETRSLDRGRHLSHATVYYLPGCRGVADGVGAVARGVGALEPVPVVPEPARGTQQRRRRRGLLGGRRERRRR